MIVPSTFEFIQIDHKLGYIPQVKKSYLKELFAQEEVTSLFTI